MMNCAITFTPAAAEDDFNTLRELMREYSDWRHNRYDAFQDLIEEYFDHAVFWQEVDSLPGDYSPIRKANDSPQNRGGTRLSCVPGP